MKAQNWIGYSWRTEKQLLFFTAFWRLLLESKVTVTLWFWPTVKSDLLRYSELIFTNGWEEGIVSAFKAIISSFSGLRLCCVKGLHESFYFQDRSWNIKEIASFYMIDNVISSCHQRGNRNLVCKWKHFTVKSMALNWQHIKKQVVLKISCFDV